MLTTNTRDYIMVLTDNREINITSGQKKAIEEWIKNKETLIEVYDSDDKSQLLFSGKPHSIREFRQRKHDQNLAGMRYICGYGTRHHLQEECKCEDKFNCMDWRMKKWIQEKHPKVFYDKDITPEMQNEFLSYIEVNKPDYLYKK